MQYRLESQERSETLIMTLRDVVVAYQLEGAIRERFAAMATVIGEHPEHLLEQCEAYLAQDGGRHRLWIFGPHLLKRSHRLIFSL